MLRLLRDAASPTTTLLIVDILLPLACYDDTGDDGKPIPGAERTLAPEGSPLLANLGRASAHGYLLDISVRSALLYTCRNGSLALDCVLDDGGAECEGADVARAVDGGACSWVEGHAHDSRERISLGVYYG